MTGLDQALAGVPRWVRVGGLTGWLALGAVGAAAVLLWAVSYVSYLVTPVLFSGILAVIFFPLVDRLSRRLPRLVAVIVVVVLLLAVVVASTWAVLAGIVAEGPEISDQMGSARAAVQGGLEDLGLDKQTASDATAAGSDTLEVSAGTLLGGLFSGLAGIGKFLFMAFTGTVILLLMLLNGRRYADWLVHRAGVPTRVMVPLAEDSAAAIRGYAWGTTIVAAANAIPIGLAAWLFGLPLVGAITLVTFITAYIPYFGAIFAGIFVCLIALGAEGLPIALAMLVIILVVNNVLQSALAPVAYGATLKLDPLVVLLVTVGAGIVGGIGLIVIAAPLTSILVRAGERISRSRGVEPDPGVESPAADDGADDAARVASKNPQAIEEDV